MKQDLELLRRIEDFELSAPYSAVDFETTLADEQGWTRGYAAAVTREYRRFLYLTQVAGHMVCPSDEVDQAWHLHLTQTSSYERLAQVLPGGFLHHHPSKGGPEELAKHKAMYQRTLEAYQARFGSVAPPHIWPGVEARFAARRVIPEKTPTISTIFGQPADAAAPFFLAGMVFLGIFLNILPMHDIWVHIGSTSFLVFFVLVLIASAICAYPREGQSQSQQGFCADPYELANLEGGAYRMVGTAMARLVDLGWIELAPEREKNEIKGVVCRKVGIPDAAVRGKLHPFERLIIDAIPMGEFEPKSLEVLANQQARLVRVRLANSGLAVEAGALLCNRVIAAWVLLLVGAFGVNRLIHGIQNHQPFMFLILLLTITVVAIRSYCSSANIAWQRTPSGTRTLQELKQFHKALKDVRQRKTDQTPEASWHQGLGAKIAMGFALFGTQAIVSNQAFAGINFVFGDNDPNNTSHSNSQAGCGGGGGGCGGGCGGCGG